MLARVRIFLPALLVIAFLAATQANAATVRFGFGSSGSGDGQFGFPVRIAADIAGNIYVTDQTLNRVTKFSANGVFIRKWGTPGNGAGQFDFCFGIAVDPSGFVYVADENNARIQKFDPDGNFVLQWGVFGTGDGQFQEPIGVAVNTTGQVYVLELGGNRVQKFTSAGSFLGKWGSAGSGPGQFDLPRDIAIDNAGYVYVTDRNNFRVQKFDPNGVFLLSWGSSGTGKGQFQQPVGIGIDSFHNVFVTDFTANRVNMFRYNGHFVAPSFVTRWSNGFGDVALSQPNDVVVKGNYVYVVDGGNDRVQVYTIGPVGLTVTDIPNDQGREVRLKFGASYTDWNGSPEATTSYEAYRQIDLTSPARIAPGLEPMLAGWDYVATMPAHGESEYSMVLPTLGDSTASGIERSTFMVRAATADRYVFFDSEPESGYSVDNLAPAAPVNFRVNQVTADGSVELEWNANEEIDFRRYDLHRGTTAGFIPSGGTLVAQLTGTLYVDPQGASTGSPVYYKLSARDQAGNESNFAVANTAVTGVDGELPTSLALAAVGANPATEFARFHFDLPVAGSVSLEILDVRGRRVWRGLDRVDYPAGRFDLAWDLRGRNGARAGVGLYFARLVTPQGDRSVRIAVGD